jgi:hypothetical protein
MKELVCGHAGELYPSLPVSFDTCKKELAEQMRRFGKKR